MESDWRVVATGTSEGWTYTVEIQERDGRFLARITPGSKAFQLIDKNFETREQALAAARVVAEEAIRSYRKAEGYPPA